MAKQGADVAINYVSNAEKAALVVSEIKNIGRDSFSVYADVSQKTAVEEMFNKIKERWSKLDVLVNNAGILTNAPFGELSEEQWDKLMSVNLKGQFLCSQAALHLLSAGSKIINIASIASGGLGIGFLGLSHYTASKGGVIGLTESMALDLAPKGINVNCVAPGAIESDMTKDMLASPSQLEGLISRIPKKRIGKPEDIGAAVAFLASDEADYITGTVLYVDGGWLAA